MATPLHATLVAVHVQGRWRGALLRGPSSAGKSDLALRCIDAGWRLVADDRVILWRAEGRLFGRAPAAIAGLLELRGQGMARQPAALALSLVSALVDLAAPAERQPAPAQEAVCGVFVPRFALAPLEPSAPARLRRIVEGLDHSL